jgi:mono/diheme cytochrome c family protein
MAVPLTMTECRKKFPSLGRSSRTYSRIFITVCFAVLLIALLCGLPRRSTPVVQAYSIKSKKSGAALFHEKGCEHCHGVNGQGGKLGPDLSVVGKRMDKEKIEHQIHDGGAAMPAFGEVLQPDEIKDLVDFLHAKRKAPKAAAQPAAAIP